MIKPLPYPPPWQDAATLCAHLCISEGTLDNWVRQEILPAPRMRGGKRMWNWAEVNRKMDGNLGTMEEETLAEKVRHATRQAIGGR